MNLINTIAIAGFLGVILLNVLLHNLFINRAVRKYVIPKLNSQGCKFIGRKWAGFFSRGDFSNDKIGWIPGLTQGYPLISTYVYIFYEDQSVEKRMTIRIDVFMLSIKRVSFSTDEK